MRLLVPFAPLAPLAFLAACAADPVPVEPPASTSATAGPTLAAPDPSEGFQMAIDVVAEPHSELWKCLVVELPNTDTAAVNHVLSQQVAAVHHMDVMALGLIDVPIEDGMHDCAPLYEQYPELMEEGVFIYASQVADEELFLPEGVAALLPPKLRVMIEIHYVNPFDEPANVWSRINAYTMPSSEVVESIWGSAVRDDQIHVPPLAEDHVEWTRCEMNQDIDLLFLSSHTHQLATKAEIFLFDGESTGELIYENLDWHAPQLMKFPETLHVPAGTGFELRCHYDNPNDFEVGWGFTAADEMCQLGIVHTPGDFSAACEIVESSDGLMP